MYRFAKAAFNVTGQAVRQVRHGSTNSQDFNAKYGNVLLVGGATFCISVWTYVLTKADLVLNWSPVGRIQPKEWTQRDE
ncbi:cytochrome c oxidase subunit 7B, mitochondrial isoform X1 [Thalassophryne amazonica]|uniref:cytochrome c oxidase subunit 7B, mitochondrial isoform X1 n=1 Tax=Thalassophryne amazonica TaxID=390379 RepID=UPI0014724FA8|nr:cytochrome c oxidase subunit 7B, mitochondrial isoform X1 [Thalassophryne amazonica]